MPSRPLRAARLRAASRCAPALALAFLASGVAECDPPQCDPSVPGSCEPILCTDADGDGLSAEGGACGAADCDDADARVGETCRWLPAPGLSWEIRYTGDTSLAALRALDVDVLNLDLFDHDAAKFAALKDRGKRVVCYFSAGSWEDWRPDAGAFPAAAKGRNLDGWPGEKWLDVRSPAVFDAMTKRLDLAAAKGCDAVDPDNVDGWSQNTGFALTKADQIAYLTALSEAARGRGLAIGLKNDLEQIPSLADRFDFAVNEECHRYGECGALLPFVAQGKPVWGIEYPAYPAGFCAEANARGFDFLKKKLDLGSFREPCR